MLLPILGAILMTQASGPVRARAELVNGARIFVEHQDRVDSYTLVLAASAAGVPEDATTHGIRHLVEHLCVKGTDGQVDHRLELKGAELYAETSRDATVITITGTPETFPLALETLKQVLGPLVVNQDAIVGEATILAEEDALRPASSRFVAAAWNAGVDGGALDPFGDPAALAKVTPAQLLAVDEQIFDPSGLSVAVVGNLDAKTALDQVRAVIASLTQRVKRPVTTRHFHDQPDHVTINQTGESRSASVDGLGGANTIYALAASFALTTLHPELTTIYNPSPWPGYVTLYGAESIPFREIDAMTDADRIALFVMGRAQVRGWIDSLMDTPAKLAYLRAMMGLRYPGFDPDSLRQQGLTITPQQFRAGFNMLGTELAVQVKGS